MGVTTFIDMSRCGGSSEELLVTINPLTNGVAAIFWARTRDVRVRIVYCIYCPGRFQAMQVNKGA